MPRIFLIILMFLFTLSGGAYADEKLSGTIIGTAESIDYGLQVVSTEVNTREMAFDGLPDSFFASYNSSYGWVGLDLGSQYVITKIGWRASSRPDGVKRTLLGVFEGANRDDFMDALPFYIIDTEESVEEMTYANITCSAGFRYVRYVGPADAHCEIAEIEFFGHEGIGDYTSLYRVTNLPTVCIHTLNDEIPYDKVHDISSMITIIGDKGNSIISEQGSIRERGNGSRYKTFLKRPYRIKFDKKYRILDAPAKAKKWTLIPNYRDKTLMRNLLAFEISRYFDMPYTPWAQAVDVILNGEYKGCYQLCDHVDVRKGRIDIEEMTPRDNSGDSLTGGYFIEIDVHAPEEPAWFLSDGNNPVTIKSPDSDSITSEQSTYIKSYFDMMEQQWDKYLDLDTFLRHFLINELAGNTDTYWSVFMYKNRLNDTIFTGPVWDFDLAFENDIRTYPINTKNDYLFNYGSNAGSMKAFVNSILNNGTKVTNKLCSIWSKARINKLNDYHLKTYVDSISSRLQSSQRLNFLRWPVMNEQLMYNPYVWGSYSAEVEHVLNYLSERFAWLDHKLGYIDIQHIEQSQLFDFSQHYLVYTINGQLYGSSLEGLDKGLFILKQGNKTKKIVVR